jgi:PAS domain S-box-containing protein
MSALGGAAEMEEAAFLAAIVGSSSDAIVGQALDGTIVTWNPGAERLYGYSAGEAIGRSFEMLMPPRREHELDAVFERIRTGVQVAPCETVRRRKDGTEVEVSVTVSPIRSAGGAIVGASSIERDMTEQRRLEQQLVQAQKLEAVGALAAGVAHDFNNVLMVIRACSALLLKGITGDERRDVEQIDEAAQRGAELTRQLLAFSKQQVLRPELTDVNVVVHQTVELLERVVGEDVDITLELASELPPIMVDRGQLGQVIVNLAVNARDAMPRGGTLTVSTAAVELDSDYAFARAGVAAGSYLRIQLTDTGTGMSAATREHVFEPFFTTKEAGTGLGLSTVHGIVKQSGGHIWLYSEPGLGTVFKIYFPVAEAAAVRRVKPPVAPHGTETVLFVEDEETLRVVVAETLRSYGYTLLEAGSGDEALRMASEHQGEIDLLLTDVAIPGVNGRELAERLLGAQPELAVVYTCGYPPDADASSRAAHVEKPYDPAELARTMRALLDAA